MRILDRIRLAASVFRSSPPGIYAPYGRHVVTGLSASPSMRKQIEAYTGWVYKCVAFRAREVASAEFVVMETVKGEPQRVAPEHIAQRLMLKPNPFEPAFYFLQRAHTMLDLTGNAYLLIMRNALGLPAELWLLDPTRMKIVPDNELVIARYEYRIGERLFRFEPRDIVHVKYPNPLDFYYGASPLSAAAYEYDIDVASKQYQKSTFENAGVPPKYVIEAEGYLTKETRDALREELLLSHTGQRAGGPLILQQGAKARTFSLSPVELDFIATRKYTRDEIITFFGVPASVFGISEDVNRANAEANHYTVSRYTIQPLVNMWSSWLTAGLITQFGEQFTLVGTDVVPENREAARLDLKQRIESGITSINEERAGIGLEPVDGGDVATMAAGRARITDVGAEKEPAPPTPPGPADPADPGDDVPAEDSEDKIMKAVRGTWWRRVAAVQDRGRKRMLKRLRAYFAEQAVAVIKAMTAGKAAGSGLVKGGDGAVEIGIDVTKSEWDDMLISLGLSEMTAQMEAAWDLAMKEVGGDVAFTMSPEHARSIMQASLEKMKDVNRQTIDALLETLDEGTSAGETMEDLTSRVMEVFKSASQGRAARIARTVSTQSTNAGLQKALEEESDIVEAKGWASSRDGRSRDAHANADGQEVKVGGTFTVGAEQLRYPGDPNGSAANIIECRCFLYPVKKKSE